MGRDGNLDQYVMTYSLNYSIDGRDWTKLSKVQKYKDLFPNLYPRDHKISFDVAFHSSSFSGIIMSPSVDFGCY